MPRLTALFLATLCLLESPLMRGAEAPASSPSLITAADFYKIKQLETPVLSPDGQWVVYVVRSMEPQPAAKDDWVWRTQLWLVASDGKTPPRPLVSSEANDFSPTWSPSGDRLAFVRVAANQKPQIQLFSFPGGEVKPLTKIEGGAVEPRWSPDGTKILFSSSISQSQTRDSLGKNSPPAVVASESIKPGDEPKVKAKPKISTDSSLKEMRELLAQDEASGNPHVINPTEFPAVGEFDPAASFSRLYMVESKDNAAPVALSRGDENYAAAQWLADGRHVVCTGPHKNSEHSHGAKFNHLLYLLDVTTGSAKPLLEEVENHYGEPRPSPDGKWIAYTVIPGGEFSFEEAMIAIVPVNGGAQKILTPQLDRETTNPQWSPDSTGIYFTAADRGCYSLYRVALDHDGTQNFTPDRTWGIRDFGVGTHSIVQIVTNPGNPSELYHSSTDAKSNEALTSHNSSWLKDRKLGAYEPHRLESNEGILVDYWTIKPANFDPAKKYPLLVSIHGGPAGMWGPGEASIWYQMQFFAARGYTLEFCNQRGSGGYGRDFRHANFRDWGIGPGRDVLYAADFAAKDPSVDPSRQVLTGSAYGGYLTAWIVGRDHRFKAASAKNGVYSLTTFYGESDEWLQVPRYWGGQSWQKEVRALLDRDSPLTYVENITTPLLIMQSDASRPRGVVQSQMLYRSLKQLGYDVEYARYPSTGSKQETIEEPKQQLDQLLRSEEFFRRYIGEN